ncbi:MAG: twin-arginine translocase subunit TatC [Micrococcales bacterium]|nr:twin-arginine translocase subunit TatC [Micrococcales bacterium]
MSAPVEHARAQMPLRDHLRELRRRLVISLLAIAAGTVVGWIYYEPIFDVISEPIQDVVDAAAAQGRDVRLVVAGVTDAFMLQVKVAVMAGLVLASPIWIYQLWAFVTPGLHEGTPLGVPLRRAQLSALLVRSGPGIRAHAQGPGGPARFHAAERRQLPARGPLSVLLHPHGDRVRDRIPDPVVHRRPEHDRRTQRQTSGECLALHHFRRVRVRCCGDSHGRSDHDDDAGRPGDGAGRRCRGVQPAQRPAAPA